MDMAYRHLPVHPCIDTRHRDDTVERMATMDN